jgi:hypothetical protein
VGSAIAAERKKRSFATRFLVTSMLIVLILFSYLLIQIQSDSEERTEKILAALKTKESEKPLIAPVTASLIQSDKASEPARPVHGALLKAISFAQNADFNFEYGESPLTGIRLSNLQQLVQLLSEAGYRGPIIVNINVGNF